MEGCRGPHGAPLALSASLVDGRHDDSSTQSPQQWLPAQTLLRGRSGPPTRPAADGHTGDAGMTCGGDSALCYAAEAAAAGPPCETASQKQSGRHQGGPLRGESCHCGAPGPIPPVPPLYRWHQRRHLPPKIRTATLSPAAGAAGAESHPTTPKHVSRALTGQEAAVAPATPNCANTPFLPPNHSEHAPGNAGKDSWPPHPQCPAAVTTYATAVQPLACPPGLPPLPPAAPANLSPLPQPASHGTRTPSSPGHMSRRQGPGRLWLPTAVPTPPHSGIWLASGFML
ncbi:UNVERIFIED_CONTAM: hypothetical protein K2H54_031251 [Gekko kuhli]